MDQIQFSMDRVVEDNKLVERIAQKMSSQNFTESFKTVGYINRVDRKSRNMVRGLLQQVLLFFAKAKNRSKGFRLNFIQQPKNMFFNLNFVQVKTFVRRKSY